jgi:hypothetical protein
MRLGKAIESSGVRPAPPRFFFRSFVQQQETCRRGALRSPAKAPTPAAPTGSSGFALSSRTLLRSGVHFRHADPVGPQSMTQPLCVRADAVESQKTHENEEPRIWRLRMVGAARHRPTKQNDLREPKLTFFLS